MVRVGGVVDGALVGWLFILDVSAVRVILGDVFLYMINWSVGCDVRGPMCL